MKKRPQRGLFFNGRSEATSEESACLWCLCCFKILINCPFATSINPSRKEALGISRVAAAADLLPSSATGSGRSRNPNQVALQLGWEAEVGRSSRPTSFDDNKKESRNK